MGGEGRGGESAAFPADIDEDDINDGVDTGLICAAERDKLLTWGTEVIAEAAADGEKGVIVAALIGRVVGIWMEVMLVGGDADEGDEDAAGNGCSTDRTSCWSADAGTGDPPAAAVVVGAEA